MRVLGSAVITMESLLMAFALLIAMDNHGSLALWIGGAIALLCLLTAGMMKRKSGWYFGSLLQVAVICYGFVLPVMFFMGALFAGLWIAAYLIGRKGEAIRASFSSQSPQKAED